MHAPDAFAALSAQLTAAGLTGLDQWLEDQLIQGVSNAEFENNLRLTPQFQARFSVIKLIEEYNRKNPLDIQYVPSPAEIIAYEQAAKEIFTSRGVPPGIFDTNEEIQQLILSFVSIGELETRVDLGMSRVAEAPAEVRQMFREMFGAQGDGALAALFLDPDKALPELENMVRQAEIRGAGLQFGFDVSQTRAAELAPELDLQSAQSVFERVSQVSSLFSETINEARDLTAEQEGIDFALGRDNAVVKRLEEREAEFSQLGGPAKAQTGAIGLGTGG